MFAKYREVDVCEVGGVVCVFQTESARVNSGSEREKAQDQAGAGFAVNGWSDGLWEGGSRQQVARCRW